MPHYDLTTQLKTMGSQMKKMIAKSQTLLISFCIG